VTDHNTDYENGLRDGKIKSLEDCTRQLVADMSKFKVAMYMLYGAIALMQFLPDIKGLFNGTP